MSEETVWWIEKGDLVLSNQADAVLAVLDGKEPDASNHPLRTALLKAKDRFQPVALGFLDLTVLPPLPPEAIRLGVNGVKRVEFALGFEGDALRTVLRAVAPAPRRGLMAPWTSPPSTPARCRPCPPV